MKRKRLDVADGPIDRRELVTDSAAQTVELGRTLGEVIPPGTVVSLEGGLGSGKTVMARGICLGLGVSEDVLSPSFILIEEYAGEFPVFHFDLYRLDSMDEVERIGLREYIDGTNVVIIEWGDRLPAGFVEKDVVVSIDIAGRTQREIVIEAPSGILEVIDDEWL